MDKTEMVKALSLKNLAIPEMPEDEMRVVSRRVDAELEAYRHTYGDNYMLAYLADRGMLADPSYDRLAKKVNVAIYRGCGPSLDGTPEYVEMIYTMWQDRMHSLYGDNFEALLHHDRDDPRVNELLIADAVKTGKWRELPDELRGEYQARTEDLT